MKIIKGIGSAITKVWKKVWHSPIGKAIVIAAAIYTGGAALGYWSIPASVPMATSINGALVAGGSTGAAGAAAGTAAGGVAADTASLAATGAEGAAAASAAAPGSLAAFGTGYTLPTMAGAAAPTWAGQVAAGVQAGVTKAAPSLLKSIGSFIQANPIASAIALNTAAGAMSPDEIDTMKAKSEIELQQADNLYKQRLNNLKVAGINIGGSKTPQNQDNGILQTSLNDFRRT